VTIPSRLVRTLLTRGMVLWLLGKLAALANLAMASLRPGPFFPAWSVAIVACLCLADLHRRKETLLLANLGIRTSAAVLVGTVPAVIIEVVLALAS
jgi:hypothetical protein